MAQIKFFSAFDMRTFANSGTSFHDRITGGILSAASDLVRITTGEITRDEFYGAGLGAISQNMPTTGTINEWGAYTAPSAGSPYSLVWDLALFSVAASTVADYVLSDRVDSLLSLYVMNGDDTVWGSDSSDGLLGYSGADTIYAGDGNDYINGGSGADVMYGEDGDDTYVVDNAGDVVDENAMDTGNDTVILVSNLGGAEYVATFWTGEAAAGTQCTAVPATTYSLSTTVPISSPTRPKPAAPAAALTKCGRAQPTRSTMWRAPTSKICG